MSGDASSVSSEDIKLSELGWGNRKEDEQNNTNLNSGEDNHAHASKRQRTTSETDEADVKPAAKSAEEKDSKPAARLPLAPTLEEYLTNDGHVRYAPRPEWCSAQICEANVYERTSSPQPMAVTDTRAGLLGRVEELFGFGVHRGMMPYHELSDERRVDELMLDEVSEEGVNEDDIEEERELHRMQRIQSRRSMNRSTCGQGQDGGNENVDHVSESRAAVYGEDHDSALHLAIKKNAVHAAMSLIENGANLDFPNSKGVTPLMNASVNGNIEIVRVLLEKGARPNAVSNRGSTALIQACHFGQCKVAEELIKHGAAIELANYKSTTALMRACQEGHEDIVKLLLKHDCNVNRSNEERMSALMLSSQRGHASVVRLLIKAGANINAVTVQNSTSLMLAVKRKHLEVAKLLVGAGAELNIRDNKNRTALGTAQRRELHDFEELLTSEAQITIMQNDSRKVRNFLMVRSWTLLQSERAFLKIPNADDISIHRIADNLNAHFFENICTSKQALFRTWTMPAPVMELISSFIPLPLIYETRLELLASRAQVDPDSAVYSTMDLIDEVLEECCILEAFDLAKVEPPSSFARWTSFKTWCVHCDTILAQVENTQGIRSCGREIPGTAQEQRRSMNYLHVMAHAPPTLSKVLESCPYHMPPSLLTKLQNVQDIQTIVRKQAGVHFDTDVATELVALARMTVNWAESHDYY